MRHAWLVAIAPLVLAGAAQAHIVPKPPFVSAGTDATIDFETPNERADAQMTQLVLDAPTEVVIVGATPPQGWQQTTTGDRVSFTGGGLPPGTTLDFAVTVHATRAGTSKLEAVQRFDDGGKVRWGVDLSVLPASAANEPDQHLGRALLAGSVGVMAVALSLLAVHRLRRRPL